MPDAVCRMLTLLCTLVVACPIGTNLGLLHLLWMLASGRLPNHPLPRRDRQGAPGHPARPHRWGQRRTPTTPATPTTLAEAT